MEHVHGITSIILSAITNGQQVHNLFVTRQEPIYGLAPGATYNAEITLPDPYGEDTIEATSVEALTAKLPVIDCEVGA